MPDDKKKQAMSLLFGAAPARPKPAEASSPEPAATLGQAPSLAPQPEDASASPARTKMPPALKPARASREPRKGRGEVAPAQPAAASTPDPYYQGASRYARQAGEQVKHSVYLDPDVSRALKVAAAMGDDPRGVNVSAIVNAALRELGYGPPER